MHAVGGLGQLALSPDLCPQSLREAWQRTVYNCYIYSEVCQILRVVIVRGIQKKSFAITILVFYDNLKCILTKISQYTFNPLSAGGIYICIR